MKKSYEMDMCNGPLLGKILVFTFPLMLSGVLQLLFNAADIVVVGRFSGAHALAAVGSTSALNQPFGQCIHGPFYRHQRADSPGYGAKNAEDVSDTVHTSILLSLVSGAILIVLGILFSRPLLELMATPEEVLGQAALYMKIYFIGMPAMMAYNFGAAILRAIGDTKRPLYYLLISGVVNVILNLIFVIIFKMGVAGVATATVISQVISAGMVLKCLMGLDGMCRLDLHKLAIHKDKLLNIARIGLPAGLQGAIFSISNVLIQSSVNSFGAHRHGWKYSRRKPGGLCIHVHELCIPDKLELHQPEHGSRKPPAHEKDLRYLPDSCQCGWSGPRKRLRFLRPAASRHLLLRPGGHPVRPQPNASHLRSLFSLRPHGCHGGKHERNGLLLPPHDRFPDRSLRSPGCLDFHSISVASLSVYAVSVLSDHPGRSRRWHIWLAGMW